MSEPTSEVRTAEKRPRPVRDTYPPTQFGEISFKNALVTWQYDEIERLQARLEQPEQRAEMAELAARTNHETVLNLKKQLREQEREFRREARDIAAEERWKATQGEDYGSY